MAVVTQNFSFDGSRGGALDKERNKSAAPSFAATV
jgi:hypothetical protein